MTSLIKPGKWIGVDFDGTLAYHVRGSSLSEYGEPIAPMVRRVREWLRLGIEVRIMTARVSSIFKDADVQRSRIQLWCSLHLGKVLDVTAEKDGNMEELWDDRAVSMTNNTGERVGKSRFASDCSVCGQVDVHAPDCWKGTWDRKS